uniref:Uncharacterized protein n=1 Tax=Cannabis sativa TaxID=3483 RepID=A0A803QUC0_CANSA
MEIRRIWFLGLVQLGVLIPKGLNLGTEANRVIREMQSLGMVMRSTRKKTIQDCYFGATNLEVQQLCVQYKNLCCLWLLVFS